VRRAVAPISGDSLLLKEMAYARKAWAPAGADNSLRMTSARMEDCTADISYFWAAARSANTLSYDVGISGGIGYNTVMRPSGKRVDCGRAK
jgi:hypothetical protein